MTLFPLLRATLARHPFLRQWLGTLLLCLALAAALAHLQPLRRADAQIHDTITSLLPARSAPSDIVIIDIDERSLQELGPWPWPRSTMADLASQLRAQGARLQVWDMFFAHESAADLQFAHALLAQPDIVIGAVPILDPQVDNPPREGRLHAADNSPPGCSRHPPVRGYFGAASALAQVPAGHLSATPDADGRLRRVPAVICWRAQTASAGPASPQQRLPQLSIAAAAAYYPQSPWRYHTSAWPWEPAQWLERGDWRFALDDDGYLAIPYQRPHGRWPAISASSILQSHDSAALQGKIVLIGATALGAGDIISTPYHPSAPGVSVHAELLAAASAARGWPGYVVQSPALLAALLLLIAAPVLLPLAQTTARKWVFAVPLALAVPLVLAALARVSLGGQLPIAAATVALLVQIAALLALQLAWQRRQSQSLASQLQSFLPPGLAQQIATNLPSGQSLGQIHNGLMAGLRVDGLARWIEQVDSLQALALVHALQTSAQQIAAEYGGTLQYVQGDTLYLSWPHPSAAPQALAGLQTLQDRLEPILRSNATASAPLLLYAALESGSYLLGLIGTSRARRSVLLGPLAQQLAAMLELSPELDSPILLGEQASAQLRLQHPVQYGQQLQSLGQFLLPGQTSACQIYRAKI